MIRGKRILVVEDEFMVAAMLTDALEDAGAVPVGPASSVVEGLGLIEQHQLDAAVVDWNLMGELSHDIARALRARGVPCIISTGYGSVGEEFAHIPRLTKPYTPQAMLGELARLLSSAPTMPVPDDPGPIASGGAA